MLHDPLTAASDELALEHYLHHRDAEYRQLLQELEHYREQEQRGEVLHVLGTQEDEGLANGLDLTRHAEERKMTRVHRRLSFW